MAWATPQADARFIAQRELDAYYRSPVEDSLRTHLVAIYFKPISELGIVIEDEEAFRGLIPSEDLAPFIEDLEMRLSSAYLSLLSPEMIATIAAILRADEQATLAKIFADAGERNYAAALEQARAEQSESQSDDPDIARLEELVVQTKAFSAMMKDVGDDSVAKYLAFSLTPVGALDRYHRSISKIEKPLQNPVTLAAIRADGILKFANPVQRQNLIRQLSTNEETSGIRFIGPPAPRAND